MKFLLDVHIGMAIARALEAQGYQILRAALAHATWTDEELLALAVRENWIIVTEDSDFSDLVYAQGAPPPPAILYVRCDPAAQPAMVDRILETLASGRLAGHMAVIRPASSRYRPLPEVSSSND